MKKTVLALVVAGFLVGCGGGGGDNPAPSADGGDSSSQQQGDSQHSNSEQNSDSFAYPSTMFDSMEGVFTKSPIHKLDEARLNLLGLPILVEADGSVQGALALAIAEKAGVVQRSHCEKGSTGELGLTYEDDINSPNHGSGSGSFTFVASSGVMVEYVSEPDESCSYGNFFHGYLSYDVKNFTDDSYEKSDISGTLGTSNGYYFTNDSSGGYLHGANAYQGSFESKSIFDKKENISTIEVSTSFMEVFTANSNAAQYTMGAYEKRDNVLFKNFYFKSITDNEKDIINVTNNYEAHFSYKNQDFILSRKGNTIQDQTKQPSNTGYVVYELQVVGKPEKNVKIEYSTSTGLDFTKDGVTQHDDNIYKYQQLLVP